MNVNLTPDLDRYHSASEMVQEALRLLDHIDQVFRMRRDEVRDQIEQGCIGRPLLFRATNAGLAVPLDRELRFAAPTFAAVELLSQIHDLCLRFAQIRRQRFNHVQQQKDALAGTLVLNDG